MNKHASSCSWSVRCVCVIFRAEAEGRFQEELLGALPTNSRGASFEFVNHMAFVFFVNFFGACRRKRRRSHIGMQSVASPRDCVGGWRG